MAGPATQPPEDRMTRHDWFTAFALMGLLASFPAERLHEPGAMLDVTADAANVADTQIATLNKRGE